MVGHISESLAPHVIYALDVPDAFVGSLSTWASGWDAEDPAPAAQAQGNDWFDLKQAPALKVPSVVSPGEFNLMVNTHHPSWKWDWVTAGPEPFRFDSRLSALMQLGAR